MNQVELEKCISELQKESLCQGQNSMKDFDMQKYALILKIKQGEPKTQKEVALMLGKYIYDYEFAKSLIDSRHIKPSIKEKVIEYFCDNKIEGCNDENTKDFVNSILCNYPNISSALTIYYNFHQETLESIIMQLNDNCTYRMPQETIDSLLRLELDVINGKTSKPAMYKMQTAVFALTKDEYTIEYILKNMPSNGAIAERISAQLINSPYINEETKNKIFDMYGCSPQDLSMVTPHIIGELYMSAAETAFKDLSSTGSIARELSQRTEAKDFLDNLIYKRLMTESIECDFINRVISQNKKEGRLGPDDKLRTIAMKTSNPESLHTIITSAMSAEDKNIACKNPNVDEKDVKQWAKSYCDKIRTKQEKSNSKKLPEHWISSLTNAIQKATLYPDDYETILKTKQAALLQEIVSSDKTPKSILKQAKEIIYKQSKVSESNSWELLKLQVAVNEIMSEKNIKNNELLGHACRYVTSLAMWFNVMRDLENAYIDLSVLKYNPQFAKELKDIMISAIERADYKPQHNTQKSFVYAVDNAITKMLEELTYEKGKKPASKMSTRELEKEKNTLIITLLDDIGFKPEETLSAIEDMYERYFELKEELRLRQKELDEKEEEKY